MYLIIAAYLITVVMAYGLYLGSAIRYVQQKTGYKDVFIPYLGLPMAIFSSIFGPISIISILLVNYMEEVKTGFIYNPYKYKH